MVSNAPRQKPLPRPDVLFPNRQFLQAELRKPHEETNIMPLQSDIDKWFAGEGRNFLRRIGVQRGQTVLDFGCGAGNFAKPAAEVAGPAGKVYALDKDRECLENLKMRMGRQRVGNLRCLCVSEDGKIPLPARSVDVVLLYDVLHGGHFPCREQRLRVLRKIRRVLKPGGLLSLYPSHLKKYGLTFGTLLSEVEEAGFRLQGDARRKLLHRESFIRGRTFSFARTGPRAG